MLRSLKRFFEEEAGLEMVEWAVVATLITSASAITLRVMGVTLNLRLTEVWATLAFIP